MEQNGLCNFSRGYYEEHFWAIIFKFGPVVKAETSFETISILALVAIWITGVEHLMQFW